MQMPGLHPWRLVRGRPGHWGFLKSPERSTLQPERESLICSIFPGLELTLRVWWVVLLPLLLLSPQVQLHLCPSPDNSSLQPHWPASGFPTRHACLPSLDLANMVIFPFPSPFGILPEHAELSNTFCAYVFESCGQSRDRDLPVLPPSSPARPSEQVLNRC